MKFSCLSLLMLCFWSGAFAQELGIPDSIQQRINSSYGIPKAIAYNQAARYVVVNYPDTSIQLATQALRIGIQYKDMDVEATSLGTIGEAYFYKASYDSSAFFYLQAIRICEAVNNRRKLANYLNGIGTVFYQLGDFKKAGHYIRKAADIKWEDGEVLEYGIVLTNLAGIYQRMGNYQESITLLKEAEKILIGGEYPGILANLYNNMGSAFQLAYNNLDSAEYYYLKNILLIDQAGLEPFRLSALVNLGEIYLLKGNFNNANLFFRNALNLTFIYQRRVERVHIYERLSKLYQQTGRFEQAYYYKNLQMELHDSIFTEDNHRIIQQLETQYQTEKKDAQIKSQQLDLQIRKQRENSIIFISVIVALILIIIAVVFILRARSKNELEKAKSRIFQNIVHDIRTPLTLIQGPVQMLKNDIKNEASHEQLELIERNADRLLGLVEELLIAAKLEKKEYSPVYQVGDVVDFTKKVVDSFGNEAKGLHISLEFVSQIPSVQIKFPFQSYEKILSNLLSNAVKYNITNGFIIVHLSIEGSMVKVTVEDGGIGMNKKDMDHVFERFYRSGESSRKQGFGIGLSIVKELVELTGGKIHGESSIGKGTTFTVQIPFEKIENLADKSNHHFMDDETILIVEDDADIRGFIKQVLASLPANLVFAENGSVGYNLAREIIPDLIITDIIMPVEDGLSMTHRIKQAEITRHIPIIMLSARQSIESRLESMGVGADGYISKPFNPEELKLLVKNTLQTITDIRLRYQQHLTEEKLPYTERVAGQDSYLKRIVKIVDEQMLNTDFSVDDLAIAMHISRSQLHRKITSLTGYSTTHFIRIIKLEKAKDLLIANRGNITEIAYECGFNSQSYFTKSFTEHFGKPPSAFLK